MPFDLGSEKWKRYIFGIFKWEKKEKEIEKKKRKEKEVRGTKKAGKRPSDGPQRCAILGGARGRFWLGQAQRLWRLTPSPPHCPTQNSRDKKEIIGKDKRTLGVLHWILLGFFFALWEVLKGVTPFSVPVQFWPVEAGSGAGRSRLARTRSSCLFHYLMDEIIYSVA